MRPRALIESEYLLLYHLRAASTAAGPKQIRVTSTYFRDRLRERTPAIDRQYFKTPHSQSGSGIPRSISDRVDDDSLLTYLPLVGHDLTRM